MAGIVCLPFLSNHPAQPIFMETNTAERQERILFYLLKMLSSLQWALWHAQVTETLLLLPAQGFRNRTKQALK
jgi:hypothetical protein